MNVKSPFATVGGNLYQAAVQSPAHVFSDDELKRGVIERRDGVPFPRSGGFAMVYHFTSRDTEGGRGRQLAVRCFKFLPDDLAERYAAISKEVSSLALKSNSFVSTRYIPQGIRIRSEWKPITTMTWVEGIFLDRWIDENFAHSLRIQALFDRLVRLADELARFGVAHGDLHRGNILVSGSPDQPHLTLIDYDAMYVPALKGRHSNEAGHPDYQHPLRTANHYSPTLDRFSFIVLLLSTMATRRHPDLWDTGNRGGEGLLTGQTEHVNPHTAPMLDRLEELDDLAPAVRLFRSICSGAFEDIPSVREFLTVLMEPPAGVVAPRASGVREPTPASPGNNLPTPPALPHRQVVELSASSDFHADRDVSTSPAGVMISRVPAIAPTPKQLNGSLGDRVEVVGGYRGFAKGDGINTAYRTLFIGHPGSPHMEIRVDREVSSTFARMRRKWTVRPGSRLSVTGLLLQDGDTYYVNLEYPALLRRLDEPMKSASGARTASNGTGRESPASPTVRTDGGNVAFQDIIKVIEGWR